MLSTTAKQLAFVAVVLVISLAIGAQAQDTTRGNFSTAPTQVNALGVNVAPGIAGSITATTYRLAAMFASSTAPTIGSGFGTTPTVVASNGTAAFIIDVGTGGTASSGVVTMPAATTGYVCHVENRVGVLGNVANQRTVQIATTTTSITVENQTISTGAVLAWTAGDDLAISCAAY